MVIDVCHEEGTPNCGQYRWPGFDTPPRVPANLVFALGARPEEVTYMGFLVIAS